MFSVYQHWDPLKVCVVGRSYPPEFYSWIKVPRVRSLFEKIAIETEEDFQNIIKKLQSFGVTVLRPDLPKNPLLLGKFQKPPMYPRDHTVMIGETFYSSMGIRDLKLSEYYNNIKDETWPVCNTVDDFISLPDAIQKEFKDVHQIDIESFETDPYSNIVNFVKQQGNIIKDPKGYSINGAQVARVGKDLYFGTNRITDDQTDFKLYVDQEFKNTRNHVINTGGHADGTYCPVCPGLIISLFDIPNYKDTFPNWEIVYLPNQSWEKIIPFMNLKRKNAGKWWIPGFEYDQDVIDVVESWLGHWTGYVEETVFDVNMLTIDPKNVMMLGYNQQVFDALQRHGLTPHVVPFRHRYFWDGGIHCVTSDLHRDGSMQDYFKHKD